MIVADFRIKMFFKDFVSVKREKNKKGCVTDL